MDIPNGSVRNNPPKEGIRLGHITSHPHVINHLANKCTSGRRRRNALIFPCIELQILCWPRFLEHCETSTYQPTAGTATTRCCYYHASF